MSNKDGDNNDMVSLAALSRDDTDERDNESVHSVEDKKNGVYSFLRCGSFDFCDCELIRVIKHLSINRPIAFLITIMTFIFIPFIFIIPCLSAYETHQRNAVIDDMKIEIDPERIYAQELVKRTATIIGGYVYSEFLFLFFFGNLFLTMLMCWFTTVYINETWHMQRRNS